MIRLLNSAMMPCEGVYRMKRINKEEFCIILKDAYQKGVLDSTIGYRDNLELIARWTGIHLPFNRNNTTVEDGDCMLIMRLKYRLGDPAMKGHQRFSEEDFEFFFAEYSELPPLRMHKTEIGSRHRDR